MLHIIGQTDWACLTGQQLNDIGPRLPITRIKAMRFKDLMDFFKGWGPGFLVCVLAFLLLEVASVSVREDNSKTRAHVETGLRELIIDKTRNDKFTNCIILSGTIAPSPTTLEFLGSPKVALNEPCMGLAIALTDDRDATWKSYDRYWLGSVYLASIALNFFNLNIVQLLYKFAFLLSILALFVASSKLKYPHRMSLALVGIGISLGSGVIAFGGHLGHSPTFFIPLLAFAAFLAFPPRQMGTRQAAFFGAIVGTITGYFDLLSGGIPFVLGLSIFIYYLLWLNAQVPGTGRSMFAGLMSLGSAFVLSVVALIIVKMMYVMMVLGHSDFVQSFKEGLLFRTRGEEASPGHLIVMKLELQRLWEFRGLAFIGGEPMAELVFGLGALAWVLALVFCWQSYQKSHKGGDFHHFLMPFMGALVIGAWLTVFAQHGFTHAWFIVRIICVVPVLGIASASLAYEQLRSRQLRVEPAV